MRHTFLALCFLIFISGLTYSQSSQSENTLILDEGNTSPKASINDVAWIAGYWKGKAFGGETEEIWSSPSGGSMMCMFKSIVGDKVKFYEFYAIIEENESLIIRLRHFHPDLKGWEEKDETVNFPLVKIEENRAYFAGFTFEKNSKDELNVYVMIGGKEKPEEYKFIYKRSVEG